MKNKGLALITLTLLCVSAYSVKAYQTKNKKDNITTVPSVDLKRYTGKWYEIAKFPNKFQKQCVGNTTAEYNMNADGSIEVINRCLKKDGQYDDAKGKAKVVDKQTNAKLEVRFAPAALSFIPQVWGDYWILDLDSNYQYSVVGSPNRKYLWILSRSPEMNDTTYQSILRKVEKMGFEPNKLAKTPQKVETLKGTVISQKQ